MHERRPHSESVQILENATQSYVRHEIDVFFLDRRVRELEPSDLQSVLDRLGRKLFLGFGQQIEKFFAIFKSLAELLG